MYITTNTLLDDKSSKDYQIMSENISMQATGTGKMACEFTLTPDKKDSWVQTPEITPTSLPAFVNITGCVIGTYIRVKTDGKFESLVFNL